MVDAASPAWGMSGCAALIRCDRVPLGGFVDRDSQEDAANLRGIHR